MRDPTNNENSHGENNFHIEISVIFRTASLYQIRTHVHNNYLTSTPSCTYDDKTHVHYLIHLCTPQIARFMGQTWGPIWVLSAPNGPHVGPMNLAIRVCINRILIQACAWITGPFWGGSPGDRGFLFAEVQQYWKHFHVMMPSWLDHLFTSLEHLSR